MNSVEKSSGAFRVKMNIFWYENLFAAENARAFPLNSGLEIKKLPVIWCWRERYPPKQRLVWGKTVLLLSMWASVSINSRTWEKWESQPKLYIRDRKIKNYTLADVWKVLSQYLQALINGGDDLESRIKLPFLTATLEANWNILKWTPAVFHFLCPSIWFRTHFFIPCGLNASSLIYHVKPPVFPGLRLTFYPEKHPQFVKNKWMRVSTDGQVVLRNWV